MEGAKEKLTTNPLKYDKLMFTDSIRVLKLEAAPTDDARLYASFVEVKLSEAPSYEAISYTWGTTVFSETLHFHSSHVKITESLASALRNFRHKDCERTIWADAVCIDQKNDVEKGAQVSMMGEIYKRASQVLIWLGNDSPEIGHAVKGFEILADELNTSNASLKRWDPQILEWDRRLSRKRSEVAQPEPEPKLFEEDFESLLDGSTLESRLPILSQGTGISDMLLSYEMNLIYDRTWFSRLWTVQEVALATKATLFCGRHELDWPRFAAVMTLLKSHMLRTPSYMRNPETILGACSVIETRALYQLISSSKQDVSVAQLSRFHRIVEIIRSQKCTDDRDRIYGLLNLRSPGTPLEIQPDYAKAVSFVYLDYALKSLEQGNVEILYDAGNWYREDTGGFITLSASEALPTWVPDFRKTGVRNRLPWLRHASNFQSRICGEYSWNTPKSEDGSIPMCVQIGGFVMDRIIGVRGNQLQKQQVFTATQPQTFTLTQELVRACRELFRQYCAKKEYPTGQDPEVAFWNTMAMKGNCVGMVRILGDRKAPPQAIAQLGHLFEKHCLDDENGDVATHPLVDMWLNSDELDTFQKLSPEAQCAAVFYECIRETMDSIGFVVTEKGFIGLVPPGTQIGDRVAIISGAAYPFVVRPIPGATFFILVGPCYIQGLMHGMRYEGDPQTISLI